MALTKNIAFFTGFDSNGATGFWVTDGTVAGTSEIGGAVSPRCDVEHAGEADGVRLSRR